MYKMILIPYFALQYFKTIYLLHRKNHFRAEISYWNNSWSTKKLKKTAFLFLSACKNYKRFNITKKTFFWAIGIFQNIVHTPPRIDGLFPIVVQFHKMQNKKGTQFLDRICVIWSTHILSSIVKKKKEKQ